MNNKFSVGFLWSYVWHKTMKFWAWCYCTSNALVQKASVARFCSCTGLVTRKNAVVRSVIHTNPASKLCVSLLSWRSQWKCRFVSYLRKQLQKHKMLETVRGYGALYCMLIFEQFKTKLLYVCEDPEHDPDLERVRKLLKVSTVL